MSFKCESNVKNIYLLQLYLNNKLSLLILSIRKYIYGHMLIN